MFDFNFYEYRVAKGFRLNHMPPKISFAEAFSKDRVAPARLRPDKDNGGYEVCGRILILTRLRRGYKRGFSVYVRYKFSDGILT